MRNNRQGNTALTSQSTGCGNETAQMAISSYLDGEADGLEKTLAEWHLAECRECNMMLSRWSQDTGLLRQASRDAEVNMLAGAIAGQTRAWLLNDLLAAPASDLKNVPPPRLRPAPVGRFRSLRSSFVAAAMVFITMLGVALSALLSGPDFRPTPAVSTVDRPVSQAATSPTALDTASSRTILVSATPQAPATQPALAMAYNTNGFSQAQTAAPRLAGTPFLGYSAPYTAFTPGVGMSDNRSGN